jgi:NhaA family Na+:H+ antiporter
MVFLLALAIVDDIGAIVVIAVFYTDNLSPEWLALGAAMFALTVLLGRLGVRTLTLYMAIALVAWLAFHESGVHATVAGVALGLLTPINPHYDVRDLRASAEGLLWQVTAGRGEGSREGDELAEASLRDLEELARESQSPLERLEGALHPWTSYVIVPVFALANAGVELSGDAWSGALTSRAGWGVALGLMLGKPIGIVLASFLAVRLGIAVLPNGARWAHVAALSMVAGIGFTVSLFITNLAFDDGALIQDAKIGILAGSALIGAAGLLALRAVLPKPQRDEA